MRSRWPLSLLVALSLAMLITSAARADGPLTIEANVPLGSPPHDVVVRGDLLYVATEHGLRILSIAGNPVSPTIVGGLPSNAAWRSQGLDVAGNHVYLAGQRAGLVVVDVSNAAAPRIVGQKAVYGGLWDVSVKGNVVYGASFAGELYVFDVTNPTAPSIARVIGLPAWANSADDAFYLEKLRAGTMTNGTAKLTGVSVVGDSLFAVDWALGRLYYYDLGNPLQPTFAGTHYAPYLLKAYADPARDVVYMISGYGGVSGIYTVPISSLDPFRSTSYLDCASCYLKSTFAIDMGDIAIVSDRYIVYGGGKGYGEFHVVDVTTPFDIGNKVVASDTIGLHRVGLAQGMGIGVSGDYVFQAAGLLGLQIRRFPGLSD